MRIQIWLDNNSTFVLENKIKGTFLIQTPDMYCENMDPKYYEIFKRMFALFEVLLNEQ